MNVIAQARTGSPQPIALAWLASQPRVITIPMSHNRQRQAENLQAVDLALSAMAQPG